MNEPFVVLLFWHTEQIIKARYHANYYFNDYKLGVESPEIIEEPMKPDLGKVSQTVHGDQFSCIISEGVVFCSGLNMNGEV